MVDLCVCSHAAFASPSSKQKRPDLPWGKQASDDGYVATQTVQTYWAVFYLKSFSNSGKFFLKDDPQSYMINEGEVSLFPSGTEHWTSPNENDEDRIMIGYDIYFGKMSQSDINRLLEETLGKWDWPT